MDIFIPRETPIDIEEIRENSICLNKGDIIEFPPTPVLQRRETAFKTIDWVYVRINGKDTMVMANALPLLLAGQTVVFE